MPRVPMMISSLLVSAAMSRIVCHSAPVALHTHLHREPELARVLLTLVGERLCALEYDALELGLRRSSREGLRAEGVREHFRRRALGVQQRQRPGPSVACATDSACLALDEPS